MLKLQNCFLKIPILRISYKSNNLPIRISNDFFPSSNWQNSFVSTLSNAKFLTFRGFCIIFEILKI